MFEDEELNALLDECCCHTQEELTESRGGVTQAAISKPLKVVGYIQKQKTLRVIYELKPRDVERRFSM